jgi:hypothetical protein
MEHRLPTTLTFAVSEDLSADFHTEEMTVVYLMDEHTGKPYVIYAEIDGEVQNATFLIKALSSDETLEDEMVVNAKRSRK